MSRDGLRDGAQTPRGGFVEELLIRVRLEVDEAERAEHDVVHHERRSGVEPHAGVTRDDRVVFEFFVRRRVAHHQHLALDAQRGPRAEALGATGLRRVKVLARLEPLPALVHERDQRDGHVEHLRAHAHQRVQRVVGRSVQHELGTERRQASGLVHGLKFRLKAKRRVVPFDQGGASARPCGAWHVASGAIRRVGGSAAGVREGTGGRSEGCSRHTSRRARARRGTRRALDEWMRAPDRPGSGAREERVESFLTQMFQQDTHQGRAHISSARVERVDDVSASPDILIREDERLLRVRHRGPGTGSGSADGLTARATG